MRGVSLVTFYKKGFWGVWTKAVKKMEKMKLWFKYSNKNTRTFLIVNRFHRDYNADGFGFLFSRRLWGILMKLTTLEYMWYLYMMDDLTP